MTDLRSRHDGMPRPVSGSYLLAAVLFLLGAVVLASPWLSGAVTIPWDAKAQAFPQIAFLARSLATGESPFWTPNVFAGHPQIADPQSAIFSPPYLLLAWLDARPSFQAADAVVYGMLGLAGLGPSSPLAASPPSPASRSSSISATGTGILRALLSLPWPLPSAVRRPGASSISARS